MLRYTTVKTIDLSDWDEIVERTYGRPYSFQQQDGCKERQNVRIRIPDTEFYDYENGTVEETVNGPEEGVSFAAWLARDPKQGLPGREDAWGLELWWHRNFYPDVQMVANDLYERGLVEAGDYQIVIDW
jgi:hypothetical protein